ncbi:MAG: PepSY domain-containing protein [Pseudonocardia sp.]
MNLTRTVLATALVAAAGITVLGITVAGTATAEPATVPPATVPVAAADAAPPTGRPVPAGEGITPQAAADAAVAHVGGGQVESIEREVEHGAAIWEVEVVRDGVEHDVDVAAEDGAVLRVDRDDADDD